MEGRGGERELRRLSPEAQLALELSRARDHREPEPAWQVTAQSLDELLAEFQEDRLVWAGASR